MMRRGWMWPVGVTVLLAAVVITNIWVAIVASGDPSFAIEADYYKKAIAWDSAMAQARKNASLKWLLESRLGAFSAADGATLRVRLTDSTGEPIHDARVEVAALFNARASTVFTTTMPAGNAGEYTAALPVDHAGEWELRFDVSRGGNRFTMVRRVTAVPATAP
jgi:nitrogen fixation protein FixH